jgi:hypothetical protein
MTVPPADRTNVTRLLNRLMALDPDVQNSVYNYFYDIFQATVRDAIERGTLDTGVKTIHGDEFVVKEQRVISKDPKTGAETVYYQVDAKVRTNRVSLEELDKRMLAHRADNPTIHRHKNGKLILSINAQPIVHASGQVEPAVYVATAAKGKWLKEAAHSLYHAPPVEEWAKDQLEEAKSDVDDAERSLRYSRESLERSTQYERDRLIRQGQAEQAKVYELPDTHYSRKNVTAAETKLKEARAALSAAEAVSKDPEEWARALWQEQYEDAPAHITEEHHLVGGAVMRWWNAIKDAAHFGNNIYTAVDSATGKRVVGVEIPAERIKQLISRVTGGGSTVSAEQLVADVLRNNLTYALEGNIQVRRGRVGRENVIQLIPPSQESAESLKRLGVIYERGVMPVYYVPNQLTGPDKDHTSQIVDRILEQYPVKEEETQGGDADSTSGAAGPTYLGSGLGSLQRFLDRKPDHADIAPVHLPDADIEARFQAAMTTPKEGLLARVKEGLTGFKDAWTSPYPELKRGEQFGPLIFHLKQLEKANGVATHDAATAVIETIGEMRLNEYDLFVKKVALDDLLETYQQFTAQGQKWDEMAFGYTPDKLKEHHWVVTEAAGRTDIVKASLAERKRIMDQVKAEYVRAMKDAGYSKDLTETLKRKDYFHHRVLEHLAAKVASGDEKLQTPKGRGFLKQRIVNAMDYSTDYIQSEFEVLQQMMYDTAKAEAIAWVQDPSHKLNVKPRLKRQAQAQNKATVMPYFQDLADQWNGRPDRKPGSEDVTAEQMFRRTLNWRQAKALKDFAKLASAGELPTGGGWGGFVESASDAWSEYKAALADEVEKPGLSVDAAESTQYAQWVLNTADAGQYPAAVKAAALLFRGIEIKRKTIKAIAKDDYVTWRDIVPETHDLWQPIEGNVFYLGDTLSEKLAKQIIEAASEEIGVTAKDLRKSLVKGARLPEAVLPKEVIETINALSTAKDNSPEGKFKAGAAGLMRLWKQWQLISPPRVMKYNIRNLSGDAEATFVGNPRAFKKVPRAVSELRDYFRQGEMTPTMRLWFDRGGIQSLLQVQEIGELNELDRLEHLMKPGQKQPGIPGLSHIKRAWLSTWDKSQRATNFREAILRYANFLDYQEQMKSNGGKPLNYGASMPEEVDALESIADRAFKLSNDLMGAYDEVSVGGQVLRKYLIPFWSFQELNARRYYQFWRNTARDGRLAGAVGKTVLGKAASPWTLYRIGRLVLMAVAVKGALTVYNNLFWEEEEAGLPENERQKAHIILGRKPNGEVLSFNRVGILDDFLEWFGLDGSVEYMRQYLNNRRTLKEIAVEMAKSPVNKAVGGLAPHYKTPWEVVAGRSLYPDVFARREIRDPWKYLAQQLGVGYLYDKLSGKPSEKFNPVIAATKWVLYETDPGETAYYAIKDEIRRFNQKRGKGGSGYSNQSATAEALYDVKMAVRYKDMAAMEKAMAEYFALGGTVDNVQRSLDRLKPLSSLNVRDRAAFIKTLNGVQRLDLERAEEFWRTTLKGNIQEIRQAAAKVKSKGLRPVAAFD